MINATTEVKSNRNLILIIGQNVQYIEKPLMVWVILRMFYFVKLI